MTWRLITQTMLLEYFLWFRLNGNIEYLKKDYFQQINPQDPILANLTIL